jgi:hypothetical protein
MAGGHYSALPAAASGPRLRDLDPLTQGALSRAAGRRRRPAAQGLEPAHSAGPIQSRGATPPARLPGTWAPSLRGPYPEPRGDAAGRHSGTWTPSLRGPCPEPPGDAAGRLPGTWAPSLREPYPEPPGESLGPGTQGLGPPHSGGPVQSRGASPQARLQVLRAPREGGPRPGARAAGISGFTETTTVPIVVGEVFSST